MVETSQLLANLATAITLVNVVIARKDAQIAQLEGMLDDSMDSEAELRDIVTSLEKDPVL